MATVQSDRRQGLSASAAVKVPVRAATTAAITLSGEQTIDGVACVTGDRVLVKDQASSIANGIYNVDTGVWSRSQDFDGAFDAVKGTLILVVSGTVNGPSFWQVTTADTVDIGTDNLTFALRVNSLAGVSAFALTFLDDTTASAVLITLGVGLNSQALILLGMPASSSGMGVPVNFSFAPPAVNANALTMSVKGSDGNAPSATNPVWFPFRSSSLTSGAINWRSITAALTLTISSGSTLGHNSALKQYIYWYAIDNAGSVELAASSKFFGWQGIVSTTAEGGAGAADSGTVMYSTTARANVPFACIGMTEDTQAAAGAWATLPSTVHLAPFAFPLISFSAHRNGVLQTITTATSTTVLFTTESWDNGDLFDAVTTREWVPPPGSVRMLFQAYAASGVDTALWRVAIWKNSAVLKNSDIIFGGDRALSGEVVIEDECNGTDRYQAVVLQNSGANINIDGSGSATFFQGHWSPQRS